MSQIASVSGQGRARDCLRAQTVRHEEHPHTLHSGDNDECNTFQKIAQNLHLKPSDISKIMQRICSFTLACVTLVLELTKGR